MIEDNASTFSPNIYLERSGVGTREYAEHLLALPESPLADEDKNLARIFESELCEMYIGDDITLSELLLKHKGEIVEAPAFFAEAFIKGQVHSQGLEGTLRQLKTPDEVYAWLAQSAVDKTLSTTELRDMAKQSVEYYKTEVSQALLSKQDLPQSVLEHRSVVVDPEKALTYGRAGLSAREQLLKLRQVYSNAAEGLDGAKRAFVDIYLKRMNGLIAGDIPVFQHLISQSGLIGDQLTSNAAIEVIPVGLRSATLNDDTQASLFKRLDYLKNGIGTDENGVASAVDVSVLTGIEVASHENISPLYTAEQKEVLLHTKISGEQVRALLEEVIAEANLLSSEPHETWMPGRGRRAADGLYQVVFNPTKNGFGVNGPESVIMVPNNDVDLYRILTVGVHELEHINQNILDDLLAKDLEISRLMGRRISMFRETGANMKERQAELSLFGTMKPVALNYARAIQSLEAGGDVFAATRAYYDEHLAHSDKGAAKSAEIASGAVLRLILSGNTNSQPMSYAEENIMNRELLAAPADVRQRATAITSLDLDDQMRLHKYDLLPVNTAEAPDWLDILLRKTQPYIDRALSTH